MSCGNGEICGTSTSMGESGDRGEGPGRIGDVGLEGAMEGKNLVCLV